MSDHEDFKDTTSAVNILTLTAVIICVPLLPMLMGWYSLLR
ncbi:MULTISPECIES: hypothetical protein [Colwellia]|nr:hypothetical protein [Colwellia sp. D2M02]